MEFYANHKSLITQSGMNHEKNINKMRILNLMTLAENNKEIPFELLQNQLQIQPDEIESFVIDGTHQQRAFFSRVESIRVESRKVRL